MPKPRTVSDKVKDDYDLSLNRPARRAVLRRRGLMCLVFLAPFALLLAGGARSGSKIYWSEEVSRAHASFGANCEQCHDSWGAANRFLLMDDGHRSVNDQKCASCHADKSDPSDHFVLSPHASGPVQVHENFQIGCAECHREHRGKTGLDAVADAFCIRCHADLSQAVRGGNLASWTEDEMKISQFSGAEQEVSNHPLFDLEEGGEFVVLLETLLAASSPESDATSKRWELKNFATVRDGLVAATFGARDESRLKFNHELHLSPILRRQKWAREHASEAGKSSSGKFEELNCRDCHRPDSSGITMRPVAFEDHCKRCHPLGFHQDAASPQRMLPHEQLSVVRAVVMSRLLEERSDSPKIPRLPNKDAVRIDTTAEEIMQAVRAGCKQCHEIDGDRVVSPDVPLRWYPNSRFSHTRHEDQFRGLTADQACMSCHKIALEEKDLRTESRVGELASSSNRTSDVLMPSLANCRQCHASTSTALATAAHEATRADCTLCHEYHRHGKLTSSDTAR